MYKVKKGDEAVMIGFVEKIIDDTTVLIKGLDQDKKLEVKVDKFKIEDFKELLKDEEPIIVIVDEEACTISEDKEI